MIQQLKSDSYIDCWDNFVKADFDSVNRHDNELDELTLSDMEKLDELTLSDMEELDTLTLTRPDRKGQGTWEFEYSYGEEADLHRHYNNCTKNPDHKNFIPIDKFSIEDLPEDYRYNNVFEYIRAVSELTVRVTVKYVSDRRPTVIPGSNKPFPNCYVKRHRHITVGTGWVEGVRINDSSLSKCCPCKDCRNSAKPKTNFAVISIQTSAHVVFDDLEGEHTTCHLFFDRGHAPDCCSDVVTLTGMSDVNSKLVNDCCDMQYVTHDLGLARRLDQILKRMTVLMDTIFRKTLPLCQINEKPIAVGNQPLLVIVSHPHGCSKHISLGCWTGVEVDKDKIIAIMYTTPTCPGSSGALVCLSQALAIPHVDVAFFTFRASHSGTSNIMTGMNFCLLGPEVPMLQMFSQGVLELDAGLRKDSLCCVEEKNRHKHDTSRHEDPGHENVLSVEKLSMDNVQFFCCEDDIMMLVNILSDLTVRVTVKHVSDERTDTVSGPDNSSSWYNDSDSDLMRVDTGWVDRVEVFKNDTCSCKECVKSLTPAPGFVYLHIQTAANLVFAGVREQHTTYHLFLDFSEAPRVYTEFLTLTDMCQVHDDKTNDTRQVQFLTHDLQLGERLTNMKQKHSHYLFSLTGHGGVSSASYLQQNGGQNNQEPTLHIERSHPEGCGQQVRISCSGHPGIVETKENLCASILVTCLGFSEARMIVLGRDSRL